MLSESPTLHMLCGKIASGKSTMAAQLGATPGTVLIAEDSWLDALFADELHSLKDYVRCSSKLQSVMGPHVVALLNAGVSVVLDFPANTVAQRAWMREIIASTEAAHQLHVFDFFYLVYCFLAHVAHFGLDLDLFGWRFTSTIKIAR